jgi:hypothetical protein
MIDYGEVHVDAIKITPIHIYYECPYCYETYNSIGKPRKNSKKKIHNHGSGNHFENRIETRVSHCETMSDCKYHVFIHINDQTKRIYTK